MSNDLKTAAKELAKALDAVGKSLEKYFQAATAIGRESANPTERGLDGRQVRRRLKAEVIARLSPEAGLRCTRSGLGVGRGARGQTLLRSSSTTRTRMSAREIDAHLFTAGRHFERGNHDKVEQHLIAATQLSEAAGIPHFGRYSLQQILKREALHELRETERRIKNREPRIENAAPAAESGATQDT